MPAMKPVRAANPAQLSLEGLYVQMTRLKRHVSKLQTHVDKEGERWISGIPGSIMGYEAADAATRQYDGDWFRSLPYSRQMKVKIARELVEACRAYPLVNTDMWARIIARS